MFYHQYYLAYILKKIGNVLGALTYADDVAPLCSTRCCIKNMLSIVDNFSKEYDVTFNHKKSKLLFYETTKWYYCIW